MKPIDLDDGIEHLHCGHCGALDDLEQIDFKVTVRTLCERCRIKILEWI